jgi:hypothetical protein
VFLYPFYSPVSCVVSAGCTLLLRIFVRLNVAVKEDTLLDMVSCMAEDVGLVHQMPFACDRDGFAATLEKV